MKKIIIVLMLLNGCKANSISINEISKYEWLYQDGYHIGDVLHFSNSDFFQISKTYVISSSSVIVGKVIKCDNEQIVIASEKGDKGYYRNFGFANKSF